MAIIIITLALYSSIVLNNYLGFFNKDFSVTFTFFPLLYVVLFISFFRQFIIKKKNLFNSRIEKKIIFLNLIIIYSMIFSFLLNNLLNVERISFDVYLFNLIIPLSIFLIQFFLWTTLDIVNNKIVLRIFTGLFLINLIVSIGLLLSVYVFKILSPSIFYSNNSYQTILFSQLSEQPLLRIPGIFSSGATNASFILVFLSVLLSRKFFIKNKRDKKYHNILILVSIFIIFLTYTRRYIFSLFILLIIIYILKLRTSRKKIPTFVFLILITLLLVFVVGAIYIEYPGLFDPGSMFARLYFWSSNYDILLENNFIHTLFGFFLLQQTLGFQSYSSIYLTDNSFLAIILHSGIFTLSMILIYFGIIIKVNFKIFDRIKDNFLWIPAANILILFNLLFASIFSDIIFNIGEIFFYLVLTILFTRVGLSSISGGKPGIITNSSSKFSKDKFWTALPQI